MMAVYYDNLYFKIFHNKILNKTYLGVYLSLWLPNDQLQNSILVYCKRKILFLNRAHMARIPPKSACLCLCTQVLKGTVW